MIWHILKKDWKLLWKAALIAALLQLILSCVMWKLGRFNENTRLYDLVLLLGVTALLARGFLLASAVHQDAVPGLRQDWLVRPIPHREILAAKLLFAILVVQGPVFAGDLMEALLNGFSPLASLEAALSRSLYLLIIFSLPVLMISSATKNLMEVVMSGLFGVAGLAVIKSLGLANSAARLADTSLAWTVEATSLLLLVACSAIILTIQYQLRKTVRTRWLLVGATALLLSLQFLPWESAAFAMQSRFSTVPGAAAGIEVAFAAGGESAKPSAGYGRAGMTSLYIPLQITGLPNDSILADDHYDVRLMDSAGVVRAKWTEGFPGFGESRIQVRRSGSGEVVSLNSGSTALYQMFNMDSIEYARLKDKPVRAEIDLSLTLMGLSESYAIPAVNGDAHLPGVGWCGTRMNRQGTAIELRCIQAEQAPDCLAWFLERQPGGRRNPETFRCNSRSYAPYSTRFLPDALARFGDPGLPFGDLTGRSTFAVGAADIGGAQVVVKAFRPLEHFTRKIEAPAQHLSDWLVKYDMEVR